MPPEQTELVTQQQQLAEMPMQKPPSVGAMLSAVIEKGVTQENIGALEKLVGLYERMELRDAEKQFASAFVALQANLPVVNMTKAVPGKDGRIKYHFAPYEEIMATVRPFLQKHGFTVTFSMSYAEGRITQNCTLQHVGGHSRTNQFMVRIGSGPPNSSEAQGDGAASTYAKRFALCNALNIVCEIDSDGASDAHSVGSPISPEKVIYLREIVKESKADELAFLKFAQVSRYEDIGENDYPRLVAAVQKKMKSS